MIQLLGHNVFFVRLKTAALSLFQSYSKLEQLSIKANGKKLVAQIYSWNYLRTNKFGVDLGLSSKERMLDGLFLAFDKGFEDIQARVF